MVSKKFELSLQAIIVLNYDTLYIVAKESNIPLSFLKLTVLHVSQMLIR